MSCRATPLNTNIFSSHFNSIPLLSFSSLLYPYVCTILYPPFITFSHALLLTSKPRFCKRGGESWGKTPSRYVIKTWPPIMQAFDGPLSLVCFCLSTVRQKPCGIFLNSFRRLCKLALPAIAFYVHVTCISKLICVVNEFVSNILAKDLVT